MLPLLVVVIAVEKRVVVYVVVSDVEDRIVLPVEVVVVKVVVPLVLVVVAVIGDAPINGGLKFAVQRARPFVMQNSSSQPLK